MPSHAERRELPYRPEDMFDLVLGVDRYPEFLPWCRASRIRRREEGLLVADLVIGFKGITERFTSRVSHDRGALKIDVTYLEGPFKYLKNHWVFEDKPGGGCVVDFHVEFEFKSRILDKLIGAVFTEAVRKMVRAFETRAKVLHGDGERVPSRQAFGPVK